MIQTRHAMHFIRDQMKEREVQTDRVIEITRQKIRDEFRKALGSVWNDEKWANRMKEAGHDTQ